MRGMAITQMPGSPTMRAIKALRDATFRDDNRLFNQLLQLAAPSYEDVLPLLRREWNRCDTLYLLHDENGCLAGFHLVARDSAEVEGRSFPLSYSGFSALRHDKKQSGLAGMLYAICMADAMARQEADKGESVFIWGTTATPTVFLGVWESLADVNPRPDGSFSPESLPLALALRRRYGMLESEPEHPFVLKGVARDTLYAPSEVERLEDVCRRKGLQLFDVLGVDRTQGDRVLFFGRVPRDSHEPISPALWRLARRLKREGQL